MVIDYLTTIPNEQLKEILALLGQNPGAHRGDRNEDHISPQGVSKICSKIPEAKFPNKAILIKFLSTNSIIWAFLRHKKNELCQLFLLSPPPPQIFQIVLYAYKRGGENSTYCTFSVSI